MIIKYVYIDIWLYMYTLYIYIHYIMNPLWLSPRVYVSHIFNHAPDVIFQQLLWLGWWRCIEVDGILWSHTWKPEDPNDRWEFSVGKSTWHMKSLRLNMVVKKGRCLQIFCGGCEVVLLLNKTQPWCLDHLLTLGGLQRFDVCTDSTCVKIRNSMKL